ncbi:MAG: HAD family hydrolase [Ginsengibacter sp.]
MLMVNTVIFDMDGVIIDSEPIHIKIEAQLFEEIGIKVSRQEHFSFVGGSGRNMWQSLANKNSISIDIHEVVSRKDELYLTFLRNSNRLQPIQGVKKLLNDLTSAGFKLALASSSNSDVIKVVLSLLHLDQFFLIKLSGEDFLQSKPDPEIFLKAAGLLGSSPQECIVIEDSTNGVLAAKRAKMKCIGYNNPNSGKQNLKNADLVINSFDSINIDLIRKL